MRYASIIITLMTAILFGCNSGGGSNKTYSGKVYVNCASLSSQCGGSTAAGVMLSAITPTATLSDIASTVVTTWPGGDISLTSTPEFLLTGTILNDTPNIITGFWYSVMPLPALMSAATPTVSGFGILEPNDWWSGSAMWNSVGSPGNGICTNPTPTTVANPIPTGNCIAGNMILDPGVSINIGGGYIGDGGCGGNLAQAGAGCVATGSATWSVKFYDTTGEDVTTLPLYQTCPYNDYSNMAAAELTNVACMKFFQNLITEFELGSSATYTMPHAPRAIGYIPFNIVP